MRVLLVLGILARGLFHFFSRRFAVLPRLVGLLRAGIGLLAGEPVFELLHLVAEPVRAAGELARLIPLGVVRFVARRVRAVGKLPLAIGDVLRLVFERLHRALECGALEHLRALLELLAQLLLHRLQIFERLLRLIARQILRRVLELFHLLHELRCQRLTKELLCVAQLTRQTAIQSPRLLELLFQSRRLLLEVLHALGERALLLGDRTRLFGGFVTHRAVLPTVCFGVGGGCGFAALRAIGALAPILRRIIGSLLQRSLRGRRGLCLAYRRIGGIASHGATLLHRRDLEQQLATLALLRPWRVVGRDHLDVQCVPGLQITRRQIQNRRAVPNGRLCGSDRLHDHRLRGAVALLPALHLDAGDAVIIRRR